MAKKKNIQIEKVKKVKTEILLREFEEKEIGEIVENEGRKAKVVKKVRKFGKNYLHCVYI